MKYQSQTQLEREKMNKCGNILIKKIPLVLLILIIVSVLILLVYINKNLEIFKDKELSPEFFTWFDQSKIELNLEEGPYIDCIFNETCNGTFYLEIKFKEGFEQNNEVEILKEYGEINDSRMKLKINDLYLLDKVISLDFIDEIKIISLNSDYSMTYTSEDLEYCDIDKDCVKIRGCCGCEDEVINKKYLEEWNSLRNFNCKFDGCSKGIDQRAICYADAKCVNSSCELIIDPNWICEETDFENICNDISFDKWDESKIYLGEEMHTCTELYDFCDLEYEPEEEIKLPDLYFQDLALVKKGRYINFNISIKNSGLADSENFSLTIMDNENLTKEMDFDGIKKGLNVSVRLENLRLINVNVTNISFIIDKANKIDESNEKNNIKIFEFNLD